MDELRDANGDRPSIEWFNSGSKYHKNRLEYVFVGSTFAVFAGNLSRKDLNTEGDFFKTDAFILLKNGINRQDLSLLSTLGFQIGMDIVQGSEGSDIGSSFCVKVSEESFDSSFVNEESHSSVESPRQLQKARQNVQPRRPKKILRRCHSRMILHRLHRLAILRRHRFPAQAMHRPQRNERFGKK